MGQGTHLELVGWLAQTALSLKSWLTAIWTAGVFSAKHVHRPAGAGSAGSQRQWGGSLQRGGLVAINSCHAQQQGVVTNLGGYEKHFPHAILLERVIVKSLPARVVIEVCVPH